MPMAMLGQDKDQRLASTIIKGQLKDPEATKIDDELEMAGTAFREAFNSGTGQGLAEAFFDLMDLKSMRETSPSDEPSVLEE